MKQIPTAEEILQIAAKEAFEISLSKNGKLYASLHKHIIEFAKLHVEACKEEIAEKAEVKFVDYDEAIVEKSSILNAYPLTNIK